MEAGAVLPTASCRVGCLLWKCRACRCSGRSQWYQGHHDSGICGGDGDQEGAERPAPRSQCCALRVQVFHQRGNARRLSLAVLFGYILQHTSQALMIE